MAASDSSQVAGTPTGRTGTTVDESLSDALASAPRRTSTSAWARFRRHKLALIGMAVLLVYTVSAIFAPLIARQDPNFIDLNILKQPPSAEHWLGTDRTGRDVFSRLLHAGRISLTVGVAAAAIGAAIGTVIGLASGYFGGWTDNLLQRVTEIVMTFPTLFLVIVLVGLLGPSVWNIIFVLGGLGWTSTVRIVRGQVLSLREMDYATAARALGASNRRLMFRHILPGVLPYVAVTATLTVAGAILTEAALSFLGFGVKIPTATWGNMMNQAQRLYVLRDMPWLWIPPGFVIASTVVAVNFIGDGMRDALDPRTRIE